MKLAAIFIVSFCFNLNNAEKLLSRKAQILKRNIIPIPDGYLPPAPETSACMPVTKLVTETSIQQTIVTSYNPNEGFDAVTSSRIVTEVIPTTVYDNEFITSYSTVIDTEYSSEIVPIFSTIVTSLARVPATSIVIFTSPVIETSTVFDATEITSGIFITQTVTEDISTFVSRPVTITSTDLSVFETTTTVQGEVSTETIYRSSTLTSTIQSQLPDLTTTLFATEILTQTDTTTVQDIPVVETDLFTTTVVIPVVFTTSVTDTTTDVEDITSMTSIVFTITQNVQVTDTSTSTIQTTIEYQITSTERSTQVVPTTITEISSIFSSQFARDVTVVSTSQVLETIQIPDDVNIITNTQYSTQVLDVPVKVPQEGAQQTITVTKTERESCRGTGYQYNEPDIPFSF